MNSIFLTETYSEPRKYPIYLLRFTTVVKNPVILNSAVDIYYSGLYPRYSFDWIGYESLLIREHLGVRSSNMNNGICK